MITERGTFDELMALNGRFAKVYRIQEAQNKEIINYGGDTYGKEKYLFPGRSYN